MTEGSHERSAQRSALRKRHASTAIMTAHIASPMGVPIIIQPANDTGVPAVSSARTPIRFGGVPTGVQIVGRTFDEPTVMRVGAVLEQGVGWRQWRPPVAPARADAALAAAATVA